MPFGSPSLVSINTANLYRDEDSSPHSGPFKNRKKSLVSAFLQKASDSFQDFASQFKRKSSTSSESSETTLAMSREDGFSFALLPPRDSSLQQHQHLRQPMEESSDEELDSKMFARLAGMKIVAQTDEEDDLHWSIQKSIISNVGSLSSEHLTAISDISNLKTPPRIDGSFFTPPPSSSSPTLSRLLTPPPSNVGSPSAASPILNRMSSAPSLTSRGVTWDPEVLKTLPTKRSNDSVASSSSNRNVGKGDIFNFSDESGLQNGSSLSRNSSPKPHKRFHKRSRSETIGPSVLVPPGFTHTQKGRFVVTREVVESSHWRPRRVTGPSRFQLVPSPTDPHKGINPSLVP